MTDERIRVRRVFVATVVVVVVLLSLVVGMGVYMLLQPRDITINIISNENSQIDIKDTIKQGDKFTPPETISTQPGYEFKGYYKDALYTEEFDFDEIISANTTIYAWFEPLSYQYIFYKNQIQGDPVGEELEEALLNDIFLMNEQKYERTFIVPQNVPVRLNYNFLGWSRNQVAGAAEVLYKAGDAIKMPLNGISLYAQYKGVEKQVQLQFVNARINGQTINQTNFSAYFGEGFVVPNIPNIHHKDYTHVFRGYTVEGMSIVYIPGQVIPASIIDNIMSSVILNEAWQNPAGVVQFDWRTNGIPGNVPLPASLISEIRYVTNYEFNLPEYIYQAGDDDWFAHRNLVGFKLNNTGTILDSTYIMPASGTHLLYAVWEIKNYAITYYSSKNEVTAEKISYERPYGSLYTVVGQLFTQAHYNFVRWEDDGGNPYVANNTFNVSGNMKLYAVWQGEDYVVSFTGGHLAYNKNGISATEFLNRAVQYGQEFNLSFIRQLNFVSSYNPSTGVATWISGYADSTFSKKLNGVYIYNASALPTDDIAVYAATDTAVKDGIIYSTAESILIEGNITLILNFEDSGNTLDFLPLTSSTDVPLSVHYVEGYTFALPTHSFQRQGYQLTGYNYGVQHYNLGDNFTMMKGSRILMADWLGDAYSIKYSPNGGVLNGSNPDVDASGNVMQETVVGGAEKLRYGSTVTLLGSTEPNGAIFIKSTYVQTGWNVKADLTGRSYPLGAIDFVYNSSF